MIKLSPDTKALLQKLIPEAAERESVSEKLRTECSDNIYGCGDGSPESLERIRFAVLKLHSESPEKGVDHWIGIAATDWRDLFMMAGFGCDLHAHQKWKDETLKNH